MFALKFFLKLISSSYLYLFHNGHFVSNELRRDELNALNSQKNRLIELACKKQNKVVNKGIYDPYESNISPSKYVPDEINVSAPDKKSSQGDAYGADANTTPSLVIIRYSAPPSCFLCPRYRKFYRGAQLFLKISTPPKNEICP